MRHLAFLLLLVPVFSCQSTPKGAAALTTSSHGFLSPQFFAVTHQGENYDSHVSPSNQKIVFVSRSRPAHPHSEIYEANLETRVDRRITFQSARVLNPRFVDDKNLVYLSTTDEDKEGESLIEKALERLQRNPASQNASAPPYPTHENYELYFSSSDGQKIERWTHHPGFDGEIETVPGSGRLIYVQRFKDQHRVLELNIATKATRALAEGISAPTYMSPSPLNQTWAALEMSSGAKGHTLVLHSKDASHQRHLVAEGSSIQHPRFDPSGRFVLYSSNKDEVKSYELYLYDTIRFCTHRLTHDSFNQLFAHFDSGGRNIYFSSDFSGPFQIYRMPFQPPSDCPGEERSPAASVPPVLSPPESSRE